jgi:hypothetical protein
MWCYENPREAAAEIERLQAALPSERELTELLRSKMCGPHQECDEQTPCSCRDGAKAVLARLSSGEREYDPDVAPCDDAEFGMKP